jgi:ATPase subunit of ABC transporter with duplicated ATPase domains
VPEKIEVDWGNKIGIIDSNGSGKSTLLKTILDKYQADTSVVKIGSGIEIGYYAQAHEDLDPKKHTR